MSVPYTILGVLLDEPAHGYSIKKTLEARLPRDLRINDGQLYPALAKLEKLGWIDKEVIEQPGPNKHLYRVTPEGRRAFYGWLESDKTQEAAVNFDFFWRHDFLQKCTFFRHLSPDAVAGQIEKRLSEAQRHQADLERYWAELEEGTDPYRQMLIEYGVRYQRMRCEWLESLLARTAGAIPDGARAGAAR